MSGPIPAVRRGAVILCGGRGTRMGGDKAWLPFGGETLLPRVVRLAAASLPDVVVAARRGQDLPPLPAAARVVEDDIEDRGPLGGLAPGLRASRADAAFVTGCDAPFLCEAVIALLFERLGDRRAAVVEAGGRVNPLCAVYRTSVASEVERRLAAGDLRAEALVLSLDPVRVTERDLAAADPLLRSLVNCNTPQDYEAALEILRAND